MTARSLDRYDYLALFACLGVWLKLALRMEFLIDDAFICFRYARNWADGLGLRYNLQGAVPVEGYSDFLWVGALALTHKLGIHMNDAARAMSFASSALALWILVRFLRVSCGLDRIAAYAGLLFCATLPSFFVWSSGGLETAAVTLAFLATWTSFVRAAEEDSHAQALVAGCSGAALALLRVEGVIWIPVVFVLVLWLGPNRATHSRGDVARRLLPGLLIPLLVFGAYVIFRKMHFHAWLPNTVHAKAGFSSQTLLRGLRTTASYFLVYGSPIVVLLLALRLRVAGPKRSIGVQALFLWVALLGWNTIVGGDWMPFFRFLAPASPLLAVVLAFGLHRMRPFASLPLALGLCAISLLPAWDRHVAPDSVRSQMAFREFQAGYRSEFKRWAIGITNVRMFRRIGRALQKISGPDDTLVFGAIGAIGFESGLEMYDRNGLVSPEVAHYEGDQWITGHDTAGHERRVARSFFLDQKPTYLHAVLLTKPIGPIGSKRFDASVDFMLELMEREGHRDTALFEHTIAEAHNFSRADGFPGDCALLMLRYVDDTERAEAFWTAYFARRGG